MAALVVAGAVAFGFSPAGHHDGTVGAARRPVVVASFDFTESVVLAHIYAIALRAAGVPVRTELQVGPRELVQPALEQHRIDIVPEYTGSALEADAPDVSVDRRDPVAVHAQLAVTLAPAGLRVLDAAPAQNQNAFVVSRADAERHGLRTLSDLARFPNGIVLGGPSECVRRPYCGIGLEGVYGITIRRFVPLDGQQQALAALNDDVVDVAVMFTTDGAVADPDIVALTDDRNLQPVDQVVPVVSDRVIDRYGAAVVDTLDAVSARLSSDALRFLNWRVTFAGRHPRAEARGWLERQGLVVTR
jgi:osmoprotectant transport system substrate-binding protein